MAVTKINLATQVRGSFSQTALQVKSATDFALSLKPNESLTAARTLNLITGDADRTIILSGNPTLNDWFDQSVKSSASPTFANSYITSANPTLTISENTSDGSGSAFLSLSSPAANPPTLSLRAYNGTNLAKTAISSGDIIGEIDFSGSYLNFGVIESGIGGLLKATATENWTNSARGTSFEIAAISNGSSTITTSLTITPSTIIAAGSFASGGAGSGLNFSGSGNHDITASSGTLRFGAATLTGTLTYTGQTITGGTLASSTINNTNTITCKAGSSFTLQDPTTTTKQAQFSLASISAGQTRTYTLQDTTGTLAQLNVAQTFTSAQTFNNGFTSYGFGASFQTGGLSYGERDDTTTTGSDVELDNTSSNDYPQIILKNASLTSIKGIKIGNSFIMIIKNQTGGNVTFKNNASVSALVSQINTGYGADLVVQDGRWIAFSFNIDTQKVDVIGGTFNTPTLSDVSVSGNITLGTDKVLLAKPSHNLYSPPSGYGYYSGDTMYLKGTVGGSYNDPTALLYNTGKSGSGIGYWFTNAAATGNDDANSLVLIDSGFTIRAQFYDAGNWRLAGNGEVTGSLLSSSSSGGIGYKTGAGGAVTQSTDKSTAVTLDKVTGVITMNNASLTGGSSAVFTLNNSTLAVNDTIRVNTQGGFTSTYSAVAYAVQAGSCLIKVTNEGSTQSEAVKINFTIVKGVNS